MEKSQEAQNDQQLILLGEIKGELRGIRDLVLETSQSTNKRIDDMKESVNRRIDDHQEQTNERFDQVNKQINKKSAAAGGAGGALVAGAIQLTKSFFGS